MNKRMAGFIFSLMMYTVCLFAEESVFKSGAFTQSNNYGWIAHGGKWKWQKAPVKQFPKGVNAVCVEGKALQHYLIKTVKGFELKEPKKIHVHLRMRLDGATPPAYIAFIIKQKNTYVSISRVKFPLGKWFDWDFSLMDMSGPRHKTFDLANGPVVRVNLFFIRRDTTPVDETIGMSLNEIKIQIGKEVKKAKPLSLNGWTSPTAPVSHIKELAPLLARDSGTPSMLLDGECSVSVSADVADVAETLVVELAKTLKTKLKIERIKGGKLFYLKVNRSGATSLGTALEASSPIGDEGYQLKVTKDALFISAKSRNGLLNGVYGLLAALGYRWYMPGALGESIPNCDSFKLHPLDKLVVPALKMRFIWYAWGLWCKGYNTRESMNEFHLWSKRNRVQNTTKYSAQHNSYRVFPEKKYFKKHPEYYSLIQSKRVSGHKGQVCATNPNVIRIFTEAAIDKFTKHPKSKAFSLTPNDNPYMCQCESCERYQDPNYLVDTKTYSYGYLEGSDLHIRMMNKIWTIVSKKFPDKYLATIVNYANISRPPRKVLPDKHLLFGFTTMPCCKLHAINDPNCPVNRKMLRNYKAWRKFGNPMYVRDYDPMVYSNGLPSLNASAIAANLALFSSDPSFLGINTEGHASWATNIPNFYLKSRFGWGEKPKVDKIMDNFFICFFGPAAKDMKNYYSMFTYLLKHSRWHPVARELDRALLGIFSPRTLETLSESIDSAERACGAAPVYAKRVRILKLNFDYLKLYVKMLSELNAGNTEKALSTIESMKKKIDELDEIYPYAVVKKYIKLKLDKIKNSIKEVVGFRKGKKIIVVLDKCSFKLDPENFGVKEQWWNANSNEWAKIYLSSAWEKQGYDYNGIAWYKTSFKLPETTAGKKLFLFVGALDEEGLFYINGKQVYEREFATPDAWKESFEFDISKFVRIGVENSISVRVTDTAGAGGIWKGMFIYEK